MIERFQTLIVGTIGFVGIILTLWYNGRLARAQRRDERGHERATLRTALTAELKINRDSLRGNIKILKEGPPDKADDALVPTDPMDDAYRAFTQRIGLLSQAEVHKVMYAYLALRSCKAKLFLLGERPNSSDRHVMVPAKHIRLVAGMFEGVIGSIDEAIDVMEHVRNTDWHSSHMNTSP